MEHVRRDLLYSWRRLRRSPGFSAVAILTLAIGIGVNTALFDVVNSFLLSALPIPGLDRMVAITSVRGQGTGNVLWGLSPDDVRPLEELVARRDTLDSLALADPVHGSLASPVGASVIYGEAVSGGYFETAGVGSMLGRVFGIADDRAEAGHEMVLSEHVWRRQFDADPNVVGRTVRLTGQPMTIIGVVSDSFHGLYLPTLLSTDVWVTLRDAAVVDGSRTATLRAIADANPRYRVLARLRPGVSAAEASARISALGAQMPHSDGETGLNVLPARAAIVPDEFDRYGRMFGVAIVALSGLVLLIACSNLTNLLLARTASRSIEIAVRMSAGASRSRIASLLLTETTVITALAAGAGLAFAVLISRALAALPIPELEAVTIRYVPSLDLGVFAYSLGIAALVTVAVGLGPVWRATRTDPVRTLATAGGAGGASPRSGRLRAMLIGVQMAACTVLLLAAGLFIRSTLAGLAYDPGFDITHTASADVNLSYDGYDEARGRAYFQRLLDSVNHVPGIVAAALATDVPAGAHSVSLDLLAEGETPVAGSAFGSSGHSCTTIRATPGLFATIRERIVSGRDFNSDDTATSKAVVIVNQSVASLLWPGQNPIGRRLSIDKDRRPLEVVGLVADTADASLPGASRRFVFLPLSQNFTPRMSIVARGPAGSAAVLDPIRTAARQANPDVSVSGVRPLAERVAIWLVPLRYAALILTTLGVMGGLIALIGIYGVTSYLVTMRTREFGLLKALGATGLDIYRSVLAQSARTLVAGVMIGLAAAFLSASLLQHLLYGVQPHDVTTFVLVPAVLMAVGLFASFVPARRAAAVDPNVALRSL